MQNAGLDEAQAGIKIAGRNTNNLIHQGYILSPCLFNLYAENIMRNGGLDEAQAGIKMLGEISITSDMQVTPPLCQKVKN